MDKYLKKWIENVKPLTIEEKINILQYKINRLEKMENKPLQYLEILRKRFANLSKQVKQ